MQPSSRDMHHLAMVLVHCLDISTPCCNVFAQELAEFGDISLTEESVKHVTSILGAFVKAFGTLLELLSDKLIGSDDAARIDKHPSGQRCPLPHLKENLCCGVQDDLTDMPQHVTAIP